MEVRPVRRFVPVLSGAVRVTVRASGCRLASSVGTVRPADLREIDPKRSRVRLRQARPSKAAARRR